MKKTVVYDFDKTLTYKDTLWGFFSYCAKRDMLYPLKSLCYFGAMVAAKFSLISNSTLKKVGIALFLRGKTTGEIAACAKAYVNEIVFNELFHEVVQKAKEGNKNERIYVVSASFEEYLTPLFPPEVSVVGSRLKYTNQSVSRLEMNCYKEKKADLLKQSGIEKIDLLYTDSYSDAALARMSDHIVVVQGDRQSFCEGYEAFERHFR